MEPLVSVIIPTYNRANSLLRAVGSVLKQTYTNFELIIIDDGSTDNTEEVIRKFEDNRIVFIKHEFNRGGSYARNTGVKASNGGCIAFLDSDDEWVPHKLEKQINLIQIRNDEYGLIYSGFYVINKQSQIIRTFIPSERGDIFRKLLIKNSIGTLSSVLVKSKYLNQVVGFDDNLESCQDWDFYLRLSKICKIDFIRESLVKYSEGYSFERISNKNSAVIIGHNKIYLKYQRDILLLPVDLRAKRYNYVGRMLIASGATYLGMSDILKAFIMSRKISYIFRGVVFLFKSKFRMLFKK